jgi:hypothetical protein
MTKQHAKKRPWRSTGDNQYIIDAGQKKFGATQCKECCIVYQIGDPEDEASHKKYHDSTHNLKFTVCCIMLEDAERVICRMNCFFALFLYCNISFVILFQHVKINDSCEVKK